MPQNPLDALTATPSQSGAPAEAAPAAGAPPSGNPLDALGPSSAPPAAPPSAPAQSANPLDSLGAGVSASRSPATPDDPNASIFKKAWDWGNTPLVDSDQVARWTGIDENSSGFAKGFAKLAQGLTSPISIALTIGSLPFGGEGGLLESGGVAALKAAGMGAAEVADVLKGSQLVAQAVKNGKTAEEGFAAAEAAGVSKDILQKGLNTLSDSGLTGESLAASGVVRNVGGAALRQAGVTAATADKVSHGLQILMEGGFTAQNAYSAAITSPRVLDALKEGDYQKAEELGVEALGTGLFGYLGVRGLHADAGALMSDVAAKAGLHVEPSVENLQLRKNFGVRDADQLEAGRTHQLWEEGLRKQYPDLTPDSLHRVMKYVQSGMDEQVMAKRYAALAEAGGRPTTSDNPLDALSPAPENAHPSYGKNLVRYDNPGLDLAAQKPHGTYMSLTGEGFESPHTDVGPTKYEGTATGKNVLDVDNSEKIQHARGAGFDIPPSAGISALKKLSSPEEFEQFRTMSKPDLIQYLNKNYPGPDYSKYHDSYELLEAVGAHKARAAGYDAIYSQDSFAKNVQPEMRPYFNKDFSEYVGLNPDAIKTERPENGQPVTSGMTDERVKELTAQKLVAAKYAPKELDKLLDSYDRTKLTDSERAIAPIIRDKFSETLERAQKDGTLGEGEGVTDYVTQMWDKDADNPAARVLSHQANMGNFAVNTAMARQRIFDNAFEGELLGKKLAVTDPIALAAHNANTFDRINANRQALARLLDNNTRADDGMPLVAMKGTGSVVTDAEGLNPAVLVNPNGVRRIQIADKVVQGLKDTGDLDKMLADGRIKQIAKAEDTGKDVYAYNPANYKAIDSPAMKAWAHMTTDTDGAPVLAKTDLVVHPAAYDYLNKLLGQERSQFGDSGVGKALNAVNREGKGLLLFGSGFHALQEGLRGVMTGISPFGIEKWDLANDPVLRKGVEQGLTLGPDYRAISAYQAGMEGGGHSHIIAKIPGLREVQNYIQELLFNKYIPGLKARAFRTLNEKYAEAYPDWTPDKVAETAAADANSRFGGINVRRLGRSAAVTDFARLTSLAPDWLEGELSFIKRTMGDGGAVARADLIKFTAGLWASARVLNYLVSGSPHNEAPFGVAWTGSDGKEKVFSIRSMPSDMMHFISSPGNFLAGRQSPIVRSGVQALTGRDEYGRKVPSHEIALNIFSSMMPIAAQTAAKQLSGTTAEMTNTDQIAKAAGLTVFPYATSAGKKAAELASDRSSSGPVDASELRRHQAVIHLEDQMRLGQLPPNDLYQLVENGQVAPADAKLITKNIQQTAGMAPDMAKLYSRASRLPMKDLISVYDLATANEKALLGPMITKKAASFYKSANERLTPAERASDPVYQRLRTAMPGVAPF